MLRLYVKLYSPIPVEADAVTPDRLMNLSQEQAEQIPLKHGDQMVPLGTVFRAVGMAFEGHVEILGDCDNIHNLGRGMTTGRLDVFSHVGPGAGAEMSGGHLFILGDAGDNVGTKMSGGRIVVGRRCGESAGAGMGGGSLFAFGGLGPSPGAGMTGGTLYSGTSVELPPTFSPDGECSPESLDDQWQQIQAAGVTIPDGLTSRPVRRYSAGGNGEVLVADA